MALDGESWERVDRAAVEDTFECGLIEVPVAVRSRPTATFTGLMLHPYHSYGCKDRNRDSSERRKGSGNESIWNQIVTCRHEPGRRWEGWTAEMKGMRSARPRTWQTRCGPGPGFDHSRHGRSTRDSLQPLRTILHVLRLISSDLSATAAPILLKG